MGKRSHLQKVGRWCPVPVRVCCFCECGCDMDRVSPLAAMADPEWLDLLSDFIAVSPPIDGGTLKFWDCPRCGQILVTAEGDA